jgi:hypothetical protein
MTTWSDLLAAASRERTLERAHSCLGRRTVYVLGRGGMDPTRPLTPSCDCSGFVAWCLGMPRCVPPAGGEWLSTNQYYAGRTAHHPGLFTPVAAGSVEAGDLIVYPYHGTQPGHIGIVVDAPGGEATAVIHCSYGNYYHSQPPDAVQISPPTVFRLQPDSRLMRPNYDRLQELPQLLAAKAPAISGPQSPVAAPSPWQPGDWVMSVVPVPVRAEPSKSAATVVTNRLPARWPLRIDAPAAIIADRLPWWAIRTLGPDDTVVEGFVAECNTQGVPVLRK